LDAGMLEQGMRPIPCAHHMCSPLHVHWA
jgi:hypothetical protein